MLIKKKLGDKKEGIKKRKTVERKLIESGKKKSDSVYFLFISQKTGQTPIVAKSRTKQHGSINIIPRVI